MKSLRAFGSQYLNEIIGLVVMALMVTALVAAQAQTFEPAGAGLSGDRHVSEIRIIISDHDTRDPNEGY